MDKILHFQKITITIQHVQEMKAFYERVLLFTLLSEDAEKIRYGFTANSEPVLELVKVAKALPNDGATRLYHYAILLENRSNLGALLAQLVQHRIPLGTGDHLVSEALYIQDPEGNDIELYWDRPNTTWNWNDGEVEMATLAVDTQSLLAEATGDWEGFPSGTTIGHLHFYGNNIAVADSFYMGILQMDCVASIMQQAAFYSINKYHHHIAVNTWKGKNLLVRNKEMLGLRAWEIAVNLPYYNEIKHRLEKNNYAFTEANNTLMLLDVVGAELTITQEI